MKCFAPALLLFASALTFTQTVAAQSPSLKDAAKGKFYLGAAISEAVITGKDKAGDEILFQNFNSITPENCLKWEVVHPELNRYDFAVPDQYVELGNKHKMWVIGHTLLWHNQVPAWVFQNADGSKVSKEELLRRLREHIATVVGRYKGRIQGWDVVNEAIGENGELRTDKPWYAILGEEGIFAAYQAAHDADPSAELHYNEYGLTNPKKRAGVIKLVQDIRAHGLRLDAVGLQEHYLLDEPSAKEIDEEISAFRAIGMKVMITELDVTMLPRPEKYFGADVDKSFKNSAKFDPYQHGLPAEKERELTDRYSSIFNVFVKHADSVKRVTFWGISDRTSWLNDWPIRGRSDYPLLFDRNDKPKPAYDAVIKVLEQPADH
ncbi:MAG TPA: endo-1,4-beta-xylanase [Opitutaceae bacterium]